LPATEILSLVLFVRAAFCFVPKRAPFSNAVADPLHARYARTLSGSSNIVETKMLFPERELKPYGEPVTPDPLSIGDVCFGVKILDEECFVPVLEPKVYIGRDLEPGDKDKFYFQDYASYRRGVRYDIDLPGEQAVFETGAEKHAFAYERALDVLLSCSLRRQKAGR
jgi:hypothetical protein